MKLSERGKIIVYAIIAIVVIAIGIAGFNAISSALTPPDPNANKTTSTDIRYIPKSEVLYSDSFSVKGRDNKIAGVIIPDGENMHMTIEGSVRGDGIVKVESVKNDLGECPCSDLGLLKGDQNGNFLLSNDNKIVRNIEAGKKIFVKFSTDSTTEQAASVTISVNYEIKQVTTN